MPKWIVAALVAVPLALAGDGEAHHSFVVFFDDTKSVEVKGTVTSFRFTNPHAIIEVKAERNGRQETWRAETNAVTIMRRRGWTHDSLKAGEVITIEGWPARDGSNYMRMRRVVRADGTVLGTPITNQRVD